MRISHAGDEAAYARLPVCSVGIERDDGRCLGEAVALDEVDAELVVAAEDRGGERSAARDTDADGREARFFENRVEDLLARVAVSTFLTRPDRQHQAADEAVDERPLLPHALHDAGEHLVEEEGHAEEHRDLRFLQVLEDLLRHHALAEDDLRADRNALDEDRKHRVGMMDRQQGVEDVGVVDGEVALGEEAVGRRGCGG